MAAAVDEAGVGRAGVLWLTRPEGWQAELAGIETEVAADAAASADVRHERDARRRLAAAKAAAERANAVAQERATKLDAMRVELAAERSRRAGAEQRIAELEDLLTLEQEARDTALRKLQDKEARVTDLTAELQLTQAQLAERTEQSLAAAARDEGLVKFHDAVHRIARHAAALADEMRALEESTVVGTDQDPDHVVDVRRPVEAVAPVAPRRTPVALPPGLRDDSIDAVDHLLRVPGMLLLVDGYNVSMVGWPDEPVREQRKRLLSTLEEKALRTGAPIEVVFDGAEVEAVGVRGQGRPLVRVRFSPPGVEADDVLLDLVAQLPAHRAVTVVSSDKRVRNGARLRGANLLHSRQLVAALRR